MLPNKSKQTNKQKITLHSLFHEPIQEFASLEDPVAQNTQQKQDRRSALALAQPNLTEI